MAIFNTVPPLKAGSGIQFDGEVISTRAAPINLLDNSYFPNAINQKSASVYTGAVYTIDRWRFWSDDCRLSLSDAGVSVDGSTGLVQYVEKERINMGQVHTLACKTADGSISVVSGLFEHGASNNVISFWIDNNNTIGVQLKPGHTYVWAALYAGAYSAETLPLYQPKPKSAELFTCQRFYRNEDVLVGTKAHAASRVFVSFPRMRIKPTATFKVIDGVNPMEVYIQSETVLDVTAELDSYSRILVSLDANI